MKQIAIRFLASISVVFFTGILDVLAVPAYPYPTIFTQSDGTQITIQTFGDEFNHYTLSEEGYTLTGGVDGDFYYATLAPDGNLMPTSVRAKPLNKLSASEKAKVSALRRGIRPTAVSPLRAFVPQRRTASAPSLAAVNGINPPGGISSISTIGQLKSLIILIDFRDIKFSLPALQQSFNNMLNQDGYSNYGSTGSAWNYYYTNSNGQFDPKFVVVGPYTASNTASYYAGKGGTQRVGELIVEACRKADAEIDFRQFADGGVIRDIFVFYAGHNQAEGAGEDTIWPHRGGVGSGNRFDGVELVGYACSSEYRGSSGGNMANIGTFCHEFGHVLGWPDFYDTDYEGTGGDAPALENYSLMCSGNYNNQGRTPPAVNILERWMVGWATPEELSTSQTYELGSICDGNGCLIRTAKNNEYFLTEYRGTSKNVWDDPSYIGGSGLVVYHVDYSANYTYLWDYYNTLNANPNHECMKLVRPVPGTSGRDGRPFFPGTSNVTSLVGASNNDFKAWNGSTPDISFTSIALLGGQVRLAVKKDGEVDPTTTPDLKFSAETYQFDALLSWKDAVAGSWIVSWKKGTDGVALGTKTVRTPLLHLSGLSPQTSYEVTITPQPVAEKNPAQIFTFDTAPIGSGNPHINIAESEYLTSTYILLSIGDYKDSFKEINWQIDGRESVATYLTLSAGEHRITAEIVGIDGSKEYLIKYITVK